MPSQSSSIKPHGESHFLVAFPFDRELVDALKAAIPAPDRQYQAPNTPPQTWLIRLPHLEEVRGLITEYAERMAWRVEDYTLRSAADIKAEQQAEAEAAHEAHVAAMLTVLPKLPPQALALTRWGGQFLTLSIDRFIEDRELFMELLRASLEGYKPGMWMSFDAKAHLGFALKVSADERIVRALCALCQPDTEIYFGGVKNLRVKALMPTAFFENDTVAHFTDPQGRAWVGSKYQVTAMSALDFSYRPWPVTVLPQGIYCVAECASMFRDWLSDDAYGKAYFGGSFGVFYEKPSQVARIALGLHVEDWLRAWLLECAASEQVTIGQYANQRGWAHYDYAHPADDFLRHFGQVTVTASIMRGADLLELVGWQVADVAHAQARVRALKEQAAANARALARAQAGVLATPKLAKMSKGELTALAEKHGLSLKKSAKKDALIATLAANQNVAEAVIGLPAEA